ncbi:MND1-interacting protein 1-like [Tripterygium wilfordii]|uniref:MND1-interacting protein 1-like n=1 Tax=Tripterygium wilfordii TaxID=458696 RepID=A0A7J7C6C8_TRIWF|nr:MND1-interacting protein 1-like [Tripterygium wilfordii]XP_038687653.1 MND1-interacting protein 1-like [Tripterygium wilfordii]KAF5729689.1 MND1-interacting protein 1-like [Tripterygium wilfordii]
MGCTVREKHLRTNRRSRSLKPDSEACCHLDRAAISKSILEAGLKPLNYHLGQTDSTQNPNLAANASPNPNFNDHGWGYCTEEQLEEILLKNLEFLYNEAISKLMALGYDEDIVLKAILRNGHCYGGMDVLTNILHNSLAYLNSSHGGGGGGRESSQESEPLFADLRQLEEYSLAGMVRLLQQVRPHLSKGDAMWCLLMSDLHVGRASTMEIPAPGNGNRSSTLSQSNGESVEDDQVAITAPPLCRFHGGWGFGNGGSSDFSTNDFFSYSAEMTLQRDIECPERFNLSPSMKSLLKRNVAMFAAGFRANSKHMMQTQACISALAGGNTNQVVPGGEIPLEKNVNSKYLKSQDGVNLVMSKFRDLNLEENMEHSGEEQKDEILVTLLHQVKELERQVKERKEWAHQKAMQAARKLSNDLTELKMLRMEREETQRLKKGKQTLEDSTMKRLTEMENALRKASGQVDRANAAVRQLETENAEIRAEMEASKLSESESVTTRLEVEKREKKSQKRLMAWDKQKSKLQDEIADEIDKIKELQRCLTMVERAQKEYEGKWKKEVKAKELASAQVEEERRSKEAAEASNKRRLEALRLKIEIDFQCHKDDLQRLEQELLRLKSAALSTELNHQSNTLPSGNSDGAKPKGETISNLLHELDDLEDSSDKEGNCERQCFICKKDEVSVVFLPCAHQVMCASCSENYGKKGKATCPCCRVPIEQRIHVFGASS